MHRTGTISDLAITVEMPVKLNLEGLLLSSTITGSRPGFMRLQNMQLSSASSTRMSCITWLSAYTEVILSHGRSGFFMVEVPEVSVDITSAVFEAIWRARCRMKSTSHQRMKWASLSALTSGHVSLYFPFCEFNVPESLTFTAKSNRVEHSHNGFSVQTAKIVALKSGEKIIKSFSLNVESSDSYDGCSSSLSVATSILKSTDISIAEFLTFRPKLLKLRAYVRTLPDPEEFRAFSATLKVPSIEITNASGTPSCVSLAVSSLNSSYHAHAPYSSDHSATVNSLALRMDRTTLTLTSLLLAQQVSEKDTGSADGITLHEKMHLEIYNPSIKIGEDFLVLQSPLTNFSIEEQLEILAGESRRTAVATTYFFDIESAGLSLCPQNLYENIDWSRRIISDVLKPDNSNSCRSKLMFCKIAGQAKAVTVDFGKFKMTASYCKLNLSGAIKALFGEGSIMLKVEHETDLVVDAFPLVFHVDENPCDVDLKLITPECVKVNVTLEVLETCFNLHRYACASNNFSRTMKRVAPNDRNGGDLLRAGCLTFKNNSGLDLDLEQLPAEKRPTASNPTTIMVGCTATIESFVSMSTQLDYYCEETESWMRGVNYHPEISPEEEEKGWAWLDSEWRPVLLGSDWASNPGGWEYHAHNNGLKRRTRSRKCRRVKAVLRRRYGSLHEKIEASEFTPLHQKCLQAVEKAKQADARFIPPYELIKDSLRIRGGKLIYGKTEKHSSQASLQELIPPKKVILYEVNEKLIEVTSPLRITNHCPDTLIFLLHQSIESSNPPKTTVLSNETKVICSEMASMTARLSFCTSLRPSCWSQILSTITPGIGIVERIIVDLEDGSFVVLLERDVSKGYLEVHIYPSLTLINCLPLTLDFKVDTLTSATRFQPIEPEAKLLLTSVSLNKPCMLSVRLHGTGVTMKPCFIDLKKQKFEISSSDLTSFTVHVETTPSVKLFIYSKFLVIDRVRLKWYYVSTLTCT